MDTIRNSCLFSRVAVWLNSGLDPSVTIACTMFQVDELAYRTSPARHELVSRHVSRVDHLDLFYVDSSMLDHIRSVMARLSTDVRNDATNYIERGQPGSYWFFQPRQDSWFAMFDGRIKDTHAFHRWLVHVLT